MGFYDFRCMVSGVSLKGFDAVLVVLRPLAGSGYAPITLGIKGNYNRFGSIDFIEEDRHTDLVVAYFTERVHDGRLVLDPDYEGSYGKPPNDIENLLNYFERNVSDSTDECPAAALDGRRLFSALIARPVWDALAALPAPRVSFPSPFDDIYGHHLPALAEHLRELLAVNAFVISHGLSWRPLDEEGIGEQHFAEEMEAFLASARLTFAGTPVMLAALDIYAEELDSN